MVGYRQRGGVDGEFSLGHRELEVPVDSQVELGQQFLLSPEVPFRQQGTFPWWCRFLLSVPHLGLALLTPVLRTSHTYPTSDYLGHSDCVPSLWELPGWGHLELSRVCGHLLEEGLR